MKNRIIAAVLVLLVAAGGFALISSYVAKADARALAGQEMREVYLVTSKIEAGTSVEDFDDAVKLQTVPAATVPADSIASLEKQQNRVAGVDLQPGEQLLQSRLVDPQKLEPAGTVPVPEGFQEVTLTLGPDQVVGGQINAGDDVSVYITFEADKDGKKITAQRFNKVLVTAVQGAPASDGETPVEGEEESSGAAPAVPEGSLLVTFAVNAANAEDLIFADAFGDIHLGLENDKSIQNADGARMEEF